LDSNEFYYALQATVFLVIQGQIYYIQEDGWLMKKKSILKRYKKRLKRALRRLKEFDRLEGDNPTVTFEEDVQIINASSLTLGEHIYVSKGTIIDCGQGDWCHGNGHISIGSHTIISPYCILMGAGEIEIGRRCQIGPGVQIIAQNLELGKIFKNEDLLDHQPPPHIFAKVTIGEGVLIGAGATILMGVTVGRGSVIPSGCTIKEDIPPYSFVIPKELYKIINRNSAMVRV
jgi:acetyltransferase-like isoleucine patch superfamily enzyme